MLFLFLQVLENEEYRLVVERICDNYYRHMMKMAMDILKHKEDAEDAVQDAFYNISKHADVFLEMDAQDTAALVSTYTRNAAINVYNWKKRSGELFTSLETQTNLTEEEIDPETLDHILENEDTAQLIRSAVNQLASPYRDVIMLKYFYHYRNIDIANMMHTDANDINGKIFRAKKKLRKILKDKIADSIAQNKRKEEGRVWTN